MMCIHCDNHVDYHSDECVTHELFKLRERIHLLERELRRHGEKHDDISGLKLLTSLEIEVIGRK